MTNIFERLQKKLDVEKREEGISALEIADLPANLRKIMRLMLREYELTYEELCAAIDALPEADRLSRKELDEALATLSSQLWLIRRGEDALVTYQVNLRRKAGSKIAAGIWSVLDERIAQAKQQDNPSEPKNE